MDLRPRHLPSSAATAVSPARWFGRPPWVLSLLLHLALILSLGWTLRWGDSLRATGGRTATVGIALKHHDGQREYFTSEADADSQPATAGAESLSRDQLLADQTPGDPSNVLPQTPNVIGPGALGRRGVGDAARATEGPRGPRRPGAGAARVSVFGAQGEGHRFLYVFDRSGSMGGGRGALEAAKTELIASLDDLEATHQFQIIFYNERPWRFNPSGEEGKLAFGTPRNKELARRFVGSITADGATRHEDALRMAIAMKPDVIFFLTDADEPRLSAGELDRLARRAAGIVINAIEFGFGPQQDRDNFLVRLARQTGGQHVYVDVSRTLPTR